MKFFFVKTQYFCENQPPKRRLMYEVIKFASSNQEIMANTLLSSNLEQFLKRI